ncbi:hypothetical protein DSM104299_00978 [Baekduia alba]|uniref:hypothetical protein n=1 Tax=Baekduia alba TaxID=2997333 RepID=UPI00234030F9|nr:hypothetical protein [Baekduia alba]WCB92288.1 hypothetical protein DSM104299_00978 [Baekduia alba]
MLFRVPVTSSDGVKTAVTFQIDGHRKWAMSYVLNDIARNLRLERDQVVQVMSDWTHDDLLTHLGQFTAADLRPSALRR